MDDPRTFTMAEVERAMTALYSHNLKGTYSMVVAELCDRYFDRSGALLGRVRDAHFQCGESSTHPSK